VLLSILHCAGWSHITENSPALNVNNWETFTQIQCFSDALLKNNTMTKSLSEFVLSTKCLLCIR
jgi:hypothetical protein